MTIKLILGAAVITTVAASTGVFATNQSGLTAPLEVPVNSAVELPVELVYARAFELGIPAQHMWRAEQPTYTDGVLVVLQTDPSWLAPRQTAEPIVYVGEQTLERINVGYPSGQLVGIVPGMTLAELVDAPIFFGQAELPERVNQDHIRNELNAAVDSGLRGPGEQRVNSASSLGVDVLTASDLSDLYWNASYLVEEYSPEETSLYEGLRATQ